MKNSIVLLVLTFTSCNFFQKQVPSEQELLKKELKQINWNQVDELPAIENCEKLSNLEQRNLCFFQFLTSEIKQKIEVNSLSKQFPQIDTLQIKVTVFSDATLKFEPQYSSYQTIDTMKIDSILQSRLLDFPKISPAIKRGIPVKTQFVLPVVIK